MRTVITRHRQISWIPTHLCMILLRSVSPGITQQIVDFRLVLRRRGSIFLSLLAWAASNSDTLTSSSSIRLFNSASLAFAAHSSSFLLTWQDIQSKRRLSILFEQAFRSSSLPFAICDAALPIDSYLPIHARVRSYRSEMEVASSVHLGWELRKEHVEGHSLLK